MHLIHDYDVPRALQCFDHAGRKQYVRVCVQLWHRASSPRVVLGLPDCHDLQFAIRLKDYSTGDVVVKRVGSTCKIGAVFELCCDPPTINTNHAIGTFAAKGGTAFALRCPDMPSREALLDRLTTRRAECAFERVLEGRNAGNYVTLTARVLRAVLSAEWQRLVHERVDLP